MDDVGHLNCLYADHLEQLALNVRNGTAIITRVETVSGHAVIFDAKGEHDYRVPDGTYTITIAYEFPAIKLACQRKLEEHSALMGFDATSMNRKETEDD